MINDFSSGGGQQQRPPYPGFWQAVSLLGAMIAIQLLILIPVGAGGFKLGEEKDWMALAVEGPVLILSSLGALGIAATWPNAKLNDAIQFPAISARTGIAIAITVVGAFILMDGVQGAQIFGSAFHPWLKKEFAEDQLSNMSLWPALVYGALIAPICEELIFRGVITGGFLRRYPVMKSLQLSSLLFALIHMGVAALVGAFVAGLLLGWWRVRSGGLTAPLLIHAGYNMAAVILTKGVPDVVPKIDFYYTQQGLLVASGEVLVGVAILLGVAHFYGPFEESPQGPVDGV